MNDRNPHRNPSHQNRPRSSEDDNRPVLTSEEVQAILSGDAAATERFMRQHIRRTRKRIDRLPNEAFFSDD